MAITTLITDWPFTCFSTVLKPTLLKTKVTSEEGKFIVYLPLLSDITPIFELPLTNMVTPGTGNLSSAEVIVPETVIF